MSSGIETRKYISDKSPQSKEALLKKILSYDLATQKSIIDKDPSIIHQFDSKSKNTLLFLSVRNDNYPLTEYLIEKKANLNLQNKCGETALHKAVENGSHKMINLLLDKGANPNIQQEFGETPMHIAATKGDYKVVKLLLLYHANPSILTADGYCPEDYANERGNQKCIDALSKTKNEKDDINSSPFRAIKDQFNIDSNDSNGTTLQQLSTSRNDFAKKKKTVEIKKNNIFNLNKNFPLSSDDDLQTDCDNLRYNGLDNYDRTPNNKRNNHNLRGIFSESKRKESNNYHSIKENNIDMRDYYDNPKGKVDYSGDISSNDKIPFERSGNYEEQYYDQNNSPYQIQRHLSVLISTTELFQDKSKDLIIFHSEKNDIMVEEFMRQSTIRVSFKKNNTLKNSKFIQSIFTDEYECINDYKELDEKCEQTDKENINNNTTSGNLHIALGKISNEEKEIFEYLKKIEMEVYSELLIKQGFDDLTILLGQMRTQRGITDANLKDAGITKPGHRARILVKLQIDSGAFESKVIEGNAFYNSKKDINDYLSDDNLRSLFLWLHNLKLSGYFSNFYYNGYHSIDLLYLQTLSKNPLTEDILENDLQIPKLGYRLRIINKLSEESGQFMNRIRLTTNSEVEYQNEIKNELCHCVII